MAEENAFELRVVSLSEEVINPGKTIHLGSFNHGTCARAILR